LIASAWVPWLSLRFLPTSRVLTSSPPPAAIFPIAAMANLYQLYYAVAWNRRLAAANDPRANTFAALAEEMFTRDAMLTNTYHRVNGGKWDKMMSQTHIGYTTWQQPPVDVMPEVKRVEVKGEVKPLAFGPSAPNEITANVISIEAPNFTRTVDAKGLGWKAIAHLGRTFGSVVALPQGQPSTNQDDAVFGRQRPEPGEVRGIGLQHPPRNGLDDHGSNGVGAVQIDQTFQLVGEMRAVFRLALGEGLLVAVIGRGQVIDAGQQRSEHLAVVDDAADRSAAEADAVIAALAADQTGACALALDLMIGQRDLERGVGGFRP
jgi:hypothetical protein